NRKSHQLKGRLPTREALVSVVVWGAQPHSTSSSIRLAKAVCIAHLVAADRRDRAPVTPGSDRHATALQIPAGTTAPAQSRRPAPSSSTVGAKRCSLCRLGRRSGRVVPLVPQALLHRRERQVEVRGELLGGNLLVRVRLGLEDPVAVGATGFGAA